MSIGHHIVIPFTRDSDFADTRGRSSEGLFRPRRFPAGFSRTCMGMMFGRWSRADCVLAASRGVLRARIARSGYVRATRARTILSPVATGDTRSGRASETEESERCGGPSLLSSDELVGDASSQPPVSQPAQSETRATPASQSLSRSSPCVIVRPRLVVLHRKTGTVQFDIKEKPIIQK